MSDLTTKVEDTYWMVWYCDYDGRWYPLWRTAASRRRDSNAKVRHGRGHMECLRTTLMAEVPAKRKGTR